MNPTARRLVLLALTSAAAIACSAAQTAPALPSPSPVRSPTLLPAAPPAAGLLKDAANGISFSRPASWTRWLPNAHDPINDGPLIYLSTEPLLPTCAVTPGAAPNPPDAQGRACDWPDVNGYTARLQIAKPGSCSAVGADETLDVLVPIGQPKPWSNIGVAACLRGPDLVAAEANVRAMLVSAKVSP